MAINNVGLISQKKKITTTHIATCVGVYVGLAILFILTASKISEMSHFLYSNLLRNIYIKDGVQICEIDNASRFQSAELCLALLKRQEAKQIHATLES